MVDLDDELLIEMNSPKQIDKLISEERKSENDVDDDLLRQITYQETGTNPYGFFADTNDQVRANLI